MPHIHVTVPCDTHVHVHHTEDTSIIPGLIILGVATAIVMGSSAIISLLVTLGVTAILTVVL